MNEDKQNNRYMYYAIRFHKMKPSYLSMPDCTQSSGQ